MRVKACAALTAMAWFGLSAGGSAAPAAHRAIQTLANTSLPCTASLSPIEFGTLAPEGGSVPVTLSITCPSGVPFQVRILDSHGCGPTRALRMAQPGEAVFYRILLPGTGEVWCDGTNGTAMLQGVGTGTVQVFTGIAEVDGNTAGVPAGSYGEPLQFSVSTTVP